LDAKINGQNKNKHERNIMNDKSQQTDNFTNLVAIPVKAKWKNRMHVDEKVWKSTLSAIDIEAIISDGKDLQVKGVFSVHNGQATFHSAIIGDFVVRFNGKTPIGCFVSPKQLMQVQSLRKKRW
jgi:hypothetical protein